MPDRNGPIAEFGRKLTNFFRLFANVFRFDGELLHFVAGHNVGPSYVELLRASCRESNASL
jgi:hypothetical protein